MSKVMKTTKIDPDSLEKLRMLAERESRSAPMQLAVMIDHAFRTSPAELTDEEFLGGMMEQIVDDIEAGSATDTAVENARKFSHANRISWGEEAGVIIGVLADGSRCDVNGNVIQA